jgi:hypothetical protein
VGPGFSFLSTGQLRRREETAFLRKNPGIRRGRRGRDPGGQRHNHVSPSTETVRLENYGGARLERRMAAGSV